MTTYVVLREQEDGSFATVDQPEARNSEHACRVVAERLLSGDDGITLIAVPLRNWTSGRHTFKAETRRRLLRS